MASPSPDSPSVGDQPSHKRAAHVRITISRDEEAVTLARPADEVGRGAERFGQPAGEKVLLHRAAPGTDDSDGAGGVPQDLARARQGGLGQGGHAVHLRDGEAVGGVDLLV